MSPDDGRGVSNAALKTEIEGVGKRIDDIKELLVSYEERIRCLERAGDKTTPVFEKRIEILEKIAEEHEKELKSLAALIGIQAKSIDKLKNSVDSMKTIWKWGLGIFTAIVILVSGLLITGQATMVFK